jgi:hypothetical protein
MDRLTWEIPFTSACEQTGRSGRRLNNDPGPEGPSDLPGAQTARHEAKEERVDLGSEANKRPGMRSGKS